MNCPACSRELKKHQIQDVHLDVCDGGCGGIWFDNFELETVDEPHEHLGKSLLDVETDPNVTVDHSDKRACPKCQGIIMQRHFFSIKKEVEVDECPGCGGFWLDEGELHRIRNQFQSEEERDKATRQFFSDLFDEDLAAMKQHSEEKAKKAEKIAGMFRFLCPSYYIKGDQKWGAF